MNPMQQFSNTIKILLCALLLCAFLAGTLLTGGATARAAEPKEPNAAAQGRPAGRGPRAEAERDRGDQGHFPGCALRRDLVGRDCHI